MAESPTILGVGGVRSLIRVDVSRDQQARAAALLTPRGYRVAMQAALSRTTKTGETRLARRIGQELNLKREQIKQTIRADLPSFSDLRASLTVTRRPTRLIEYGSLRQTRTGVRVKVRKTKAAEVLPSTFLATMKSGHRDVFERRRAKTFRMLQDLSWYGVNESRRVRALFKVGGTGRAARLPLDKRQGPTTAGVLAGVPRMLEEVVADLAGVLNKNTASQIDRVLARKGLAKVERIIGRIDG